MRFTPEVIGQLLLHALEWVGVAILLSVFATFSAMAVRFNTWPRRWQKAFVVLFVFVPAMLFVQCVGR